MELHSWAEVIDEFNRLYHEAMKNGFEPSDGTSLFDFITLDMMLRGAGSHIGYKFPEDLKAFRSVLNRLKNEQKLIKKKKRVNKELKFNSRVPKKQKRRMRKSSDELMMEYASPTETLEEQVKRLGLNPDTYF